MLALRADSPIQYIKGVGPRRAEFFAAAGLRTVDDLLHYFPFRHELQTGETAIADLRPGAIATVRGEVLRTGGKPPGLRCEVHDGTDRITLRWFNAPFTPLRVQRGAMVIATGPVQVYNDRLEMLQPALQVFAPDTPILSRPGAAQLVGVYHATGELKSNLVRRAIEAVLEQPVLPIEQVLPEAIRLRHRLLRREDAIRRMHRPADEKQLELARRTLAFEELFLVELAMALRRHKLLSTQQGVRLLVTPAIDERIRARFPFQLTAGQDQVIREIVRDLRSGRPMTRLLQGDVGSGKTVVALYACLVAIAAGKQAAIMAPTEILAQQHFANIEKYLAGSRVRRVLLSGGQPRRQRLETLSAIEHGELDLVVGTQALIQKDVAFSDLALVVIDEQHKFGVLQRHTFRTKGPGPHYLVMTATPIPRTLAMTVFGDLDVSILRQAPPGRGRIVTRVVPLAKWATVMTYVRQRLEAGEQAYVVCPAIGEDDAAPPAGEPPPNAVLSRAQPTADPRRAAEFDGASPGFRVRRAREPLTSVREMIARLTAGPWRGLNVGLLHGGLPAPLKRQIIERFSAGTLHAIVSTTVVEVGVDVPSATIMVVEHAERFGLSQLHQLRGRIGRGNRDGLCVLIAHDADALSGGKAAGRLAAMAATTDGFKIAEADLRQRGPGQFFGTRQHGLPELRVASLIDDFALLEQARQAAFELVKSDPRLQQPEHRALEPALRKMFGKHLVLIDAA